MNNIVDAKTIDNSMERNSQISKVMMLFPTLYLLLLGLILPISAQRGTRHQKCDSQIGCSSRDSSSDTKYESVDGYRRADDRPNANQGFNKESGSIRFEEDSDYESDINKNRKSPVDDLPLHSKDDGYKPASVDVGHNPLSGSNGHNPKATANPIYDSYKPKPSEIDSSGYNQRPDHYIPRPQEYEYKPNFDSNSDKPKPSGSGSGEYNLRTDRLPRPKPSEIGSGGYNQRPGSYIPRPQEFENKPNFDPNSEKSSGSDSEYNLRPDRYIPRPTHEEYNPKPVVIPNQDKYNPKPVAIPNIYNPKPSNHNQRPDHYDPRPVDGEHRYKPSDSYSPLPEIGPKPKPSGGDNRPQSGNPDVPYYPNKDLGGYHDLKDEDYNDPKKEEHLEEKPLVDGNCICVPYYQCQEGHIVTDGAGIIDARKKPYPEEELPLDGKFKPPTCGPFHVCCNTPETSTVRPYEHRCGVRNPSGINSRLLSPSNKGEADFGEWPWQAAVLKSEGKVNIFQCGGVLIDKSHVLTVAHCVFHLHKYDEYPLKVRLGEWDTQTTSEFLAHEDYRVSKIIVHPEYRNMSLWNDVAILRLEEAVLFAPHIDTICLPKYDEIFIQQNCVVTGWGKDAYKGGSFSNIMKEVALQVIDNYQCEEMLRKTRLGRFFQLHEGFLCAGGEYGLDSCKGDGGGPLVCYRKDKSYALAGIVSWGIDCGQPGVPGVYVKIQKYLDWISKTTGVYLEDYWPKQ